MFRMPSWDEISSGERRDRLTGLDQRSRRIHLRSGGFVRAVAQFAEHLAIHVIRRLNPQRGEDGGSKVQNAGAFRTCPAAACQAL